jgi:hypothetical protein
MKLPPTTTVADEKITRYLLVPQERGDKSRFLGLAGYTMEKAERLRQDLIEQILPLEARPLEANQFGQYFEIIGKLNGPNGRTLLVRTIWMTEHLSRKTKFITLIPAPRNNDED